MKNRIGVGRLPGVAARDERCPGHRDVRSTGHRHASAPWAWRCRFASSAPPRFAAALCSPCRRRRGASARRRARRCRAWRRRCPCGSRTAACRGRSCARHGRQRRPRLRGVQGLVPHRRPGHPGPRLRRGRPALLRGLHGAPPLRRGRPARAGHDRAWARRRSPASTRAGGEAPRPRARRSGSTRPPRASRCGSSSFSTSRIVLAENFDPALAEAARTRRNFTDGPRARSPRPRRQPHAHLPRRRRLPGAAPLDRLDGAVGRHQRQPLGAVAVALRPRAGRRRAPTTGWCRRPSTSRWGPRC